MTQAELIGKIQESHAEKSKAEIGRILETLGEIVETSLFNGEEINLPFGKLKTKRRAARTARNPKDGSVVEVPAKIVAVFKPSKELRDAIA